MYPEQLAKTPKSLPWAEPMMSLFGGSWTNEQQGLNRETGVTSPPHTSTKELQGAQVWVFFEQGNWNRPIYFGACQGGEGWHSEHNNQHVIKTDNVRVRVDERPSDIKSTCKFDTYNQDCNSNGGNEVQSDVETTVDVEILGNVNLIVNGNVNLKINGDYYEQHTGNKYETLNGDLYRKHVGDVYFQHEGDVLHEHTGDRTYLQTGDQTEEQQGDQTYTQIGDKTYTQDGDQDYFQIGDRILFQEGDVDEVQIGDNRLEQKGNRYLTLVGEWIITHIGDETNTKNGKLVRTITASNQSEMAQGKGSEIITIMMESKLQAGVNIEHKAGVQCKRQATYIDDQGSIINHN